MTSREKFEAWVKFHLDDKFTEVPLYRGNGGLNYLDSQVDLAWIAWQAAETDMSVHLANAESKCRELAAENAGLKSGASYFSYGSEHHFEWHKAAAEAVEAAEAAIDDYRGDACDGWSEEVDSICWGVIMQSSTKVGERPRNEDDCCDPAIDTICDYVLLPNIETPATDAFLAEVRAQSVEMLYASRAAQWPDELLAEIDEFAAQIRKGDAL
ncbi:hypothetical protein HV173_10405 [Citrobacter freundii]|nr:hypothetical protein [Citrobacter freundii]QLU64685.1 hypothetical protein HV173_04710 [Citrobacter freundii]QLU64686.1 hypothetical protein HV173_10405 [Citrobacter freundii]